jgi:hypothetical protein
VELKQKLQIKAGQTVAVVNAPPGPVVAAMFADADAASADAVIGFAVQRADLESLKPVLEAARADRLAWIGYPKAGQLGTDLNRDRLAEAVRQRGVQPVRQVSIDDTWSALRLRPSRT